MSLIKKRFIIHIYLDQLTIYGPICLGKSIEYMLLTTYLCDFCEFLASAEEHYKIISSWKRLHDFGSFKP